MAKHKGKSKAKAGLGLDDELGEPSEPEGSPLRHTCVEVTGFDATYEGSRQATQLLRLVERISTTSGCGVTTVFQDLLRLTRTVYGAHLDLLQRVVDEAHHDVSDTAQRLQVAAAAVPMAKLPAEQEGKYRAFRVMYQEALERTQGDDLGALRQIDERYRQARNYDQTLAELGLAFHVLIDAACCPVCGRATYLDVVGYAYMQGIVSHLGQSGSGQFFTPLNVAYMMALMSGADEVEPQAWDRLRAACRQTYADRPERLAYALGLIDQLVPRPELRRIETSLRSGRPVASEGDGATAEAVVEGAPPCEGDGPEAEACNDGPEAKTHDPFVDGIIALMLGMRRIEQHREAKHCLTIEIIPEVRTQIDPLKMIDPTCGSGVMLLAWAAAIPDYLIPWGCVALYGVDLDPLCTEIARTNAVLYGLDGRTPYIWFDELAEPAAGEAELAQVAAPSSQALLLPATLPAREVQQVREVLAPVLSAPDEAARAEALSELREARREAEQQFLSRQLQLIDDEPGGAGGPAAARTQPRRARQAGAARDSGQQLLPFFVTAPEEAEV
jgi:N-6 DNA Methylase